MHLFLRYVRAAIEIVCRHPELILFFDIYDELKHRVDILSECDRRIERRRAEEPKHRTIDIQTDTHPIPDNKDNQYAWNLWECQRARIRLTHVQRLRTRSTQTIQSAFRRENQSQTSIL